MHLNKQDKEWLHSLHGVEDVNLSDHSGEALKKYLRLIANRQTPVRKLKIASCRLLEIPDHVTRMPDLEVLDLSRNKIHDIDPSQLSVLGARLIQLDLTSNVLANVEFCIALRRIRTLIFSNNNIRRLCDSIGQMVTLNVLDLSNNKLETLPKAVNQLENLRKLVLDKNHIRSLPDGMGTNLIQLEELTLSHNALKRFPEVQRGDYPQLLKLDLRHNDICAVPGSVRELRNLETLMLGGNPNLGLLSYELATMPLLHTVSLVGGRGKGLQVVENLYPRGMKEVLLRLGAPEHVMAGAIDVSAMDNPVIPPALKSAGNAATSLPPRVQSSDVRSGGVVSDTGGENRNTRGSNGYNIDGGGGGGDGVGDGDDDDDDDDGA
eukprot:Rmarinus@m.5750